METIKKVEKNLYLIACDEKNNIFNYLDVLQELGDFKIILNNNIQTCCINSLLCFNEIVEKISTKNNGEKYLVVSALTLPMINNIDDEDLKLWALEKEKENIILKMSEKSFDNANKFVSEMEKELEKIKTIKNKNKKEKIKNKGGR